ncbi:RNA-directed DNA polymerase, eukaryota, reverse transcriptase zinc-binding domain protein, partial [Tanacetum coccineum]
CNMARCSNWNDILQKFVSKLSPWKARILCVGGRLSLVKSVLGNLHTYYMSIYMMSVSIQKKLESMRNNFFIGGDLEEKKMSLVKWKKCLANKDLGGLGIGSIYGLNLGLLFKWVWRFLCNSPNLWVRVVKILHGANGGIMEDSNYSSCYSPWSGILSSIRRLKSKGIDLLSLCVRKIGNGASCRFWDDIWCGNQPFKLQFPRIYQLESVKDCFIADRIGISDWIAVFRRPPRGGAETSQFNDLLSLIQDVVLSDSSDSWMWSVDASSGYTVASGRTLIDSNILDVAPKATRWNRLIPNKVNVFIWSLMLNKLPTRVNLDRRDIDVGSILCPICLEDIETVNHIFFSCNMAKDLWSMFAIWWDIDIPVYILMVLGTLSCGIYGNQSGTLTGSEDATVLDAPASRFTVFDLFVKRDVGTFFRVSGETFTVQISDSSNSNNESGIAGPVGSQRR